jgi:AcrR family transcriptional regulator
MNETRQNIICATERLLRTHGLIRLTTRAIAHEAGVADGLIYHHFKDKAEVIHEVIEQRMHGAKDVLQSLPLQVGQRTVTENLEDVLQVIYQSHYETAPLVYSIFADHQLRTRLQEIIKERDIGPQHAIKGLALYLAAEQRLGRVAQNIIPQSAAKCLWMISVQMTMYDHLMGQEVDADRILQEIHQVIQTLVVGFTPRVPEKKKISQKKRRKQ